ncbi:MAG: single-stranded-DNA-specific exonuclease RecJ [Acidobacteriota bacterium]|nr:single-stranded-DNA-specific exonuclease RecJ [Acidobacteriota bacterium]
MAVSILDSIGPAGVAPADGAVRSPEPAPPTRIELPGYDLGAALRLERELGVSHVLAQILARRGYREPAAVRAFLAADQRHDPSLFAGLDRALELIWGHVRAGTRIVVHGDYDVDGVCATAVLVRALRALGADAGWYLPSRSADGYGLAAATVERLCQAGTGLLITVDCGITAVEQVAAARAAGMDVVITDHHAPRSDGELPDCQIVHPAICRYPTAELCGTAVAHKLAEALGAPTAAEDLELVALATVADLMPLRGENRRIVREGLIQMAGTRRVGLRALMKVSRTDPSGLDASCLAFRLAPRINAAGRMRRADAGLELLLTDNPQRAEEIARELDAVNAERRATEQQITWEADALAKELGERSAYVLAAAGWHAGVIGIVASKIVERHHRPTIMLALDPSDATAPAHGSGRSIPGFDLLAALEATGEHLITYGGHRAAAGLSIASEQIPAFREAFERHAGELLTPELLAPAERVDAVVSGADLSLALAEELELLAPFGNGNPEVRLYVAGATFDAVRTMGEADQHVRFNVNSGGVRANAVAFGCDGRIAGADGKPIDASFKLERNVWNGVVEPRLILQHGVPCRPPTIHVLGEPDDYLTTALMELDRELEEPAEMEPAGGDESEPWEDLAELAERTVLDRRGQSPLATIADAQAAAVASESQTLVICANTPRRLAALGSRRGGFALISHDSLADEPELITTFEHVVILDPPVSREQDAVAKLGRGYAHLAWGEAELRFAQQTHELEYALRASLVALYRALRERGRVAGEELERLLRGDGSHARSARLAGRMLRVFTELELISLDPDLPSLAVTGAQRTELERSAAYGAYAKLHEDGQRFLSGLQARRAN